MGKALIIAEKPSVANDIARALGGFTKHGDYHESDDYVLSSAVGHLLEIYAPEDPKKGKWSFTHLPVVPKEFAVQPIAKNEDRLKVLTKLIKRKDVTALINACDAGREGELIFRYIAQHAGAKQPVQRLWLQSMTPKAIREAFGDLRADKDMLPLADAARCRSEADWLVGINGTRAMTAFNSLDGGFFLTTVGRVQTPTLAILIEREERIRKFVSRNYWEVRATFGAKAGPYEGRWYDPKFKKDEDAERKDSRLWTAQEAQAIVDACKGQTATVTEESKPASQASPLLYDLTSLQREANSRFGFSAKTTLALAQALYEKHKALTYPRTDSRYLPEDYLGTVKQTMEMFTGSGDTPPAWVTRYGAFAQQALNNNWVKPTKRVFDNTKVSDHFAIIPTQQAPKALSEAEEKLYDMVVKRFLAIFFPSAEYQVTTRISQVKEHLFKTEGKVLVNPGWLAVYGKQMQDEDATLVPVGAGEKPPASEVISTGLATKPPARYSEATLLSAMENAGKLIEDEDLAEAMAGKGLGTPATRAATIEGLILENYVHREGRDLQPTPKAFQLMTLLRGLKAEELTSPELTGEWEFKLSQIEKGKLTRDQFMREIAQMTHTLVRRAKEYDSDTIPGDYATLKTPCPKCANVVKENYRRYACTNCDFSITKHPGGRTFDVSEVETLLGEKRVGPFTDFRSRLGRPFSAEIIINAEGKLEFDFGQPSEEENGEEVDFSAQTTLGPCPKCGNHVYEHGMAYVCERSVGPSRTCDFRSGKVILQQAIEPTQMQKLLGTGKTDLLQDFVSSRTRRKFKAYLAWDSGKGQVGFEFQDRGDGAARKSSAKSAAKTAAPAKATKAATKAAAKKAPAKKTAAKATGEKKAASGGYAKPLTPSSELAAVVGSAPIARTEVTKKLWEYIKANNLQDPADKRQIIADAKLKPIFGADKIGMFQMTAAVGKHLS